MWEVKELKLGAWPVGRAELEEACTEGSVRGPREKWEGNGLGEELAADRGGGGGGDQVKVRGLH